MTFRASDRQAKGSSQGVDDVLEPIAVFDGCKELWTTLGSGYRLAVIPCSLRLSMSLDDSKPVRVSGNTPIQIVAGVV